MTTHKLSFLLLLLAVFATVSTTIATDFINSVCRTTPYPKTCINTLSPYSKQIQKSPRQIAQIALTISLSKARYTKTYMAQIKGLRPKEAAVTKDCMEEIDDAVDRLAKSVNEFKTAVRGRSRREVMWRMSNVKTWVSAGLTDVNTCIDEVKGLRSWWDNKIRVLTQFKGVMERTSNALSLVNQFANQFANK